MSTSIFKRLKRLINPLYFFGLFAVAIAIVSQVDRRMGADFQYHRFRAVLRQIDTLEINEPTVVAIGPSDINLNFSPNYIRKKYPSDIRFLNFGVILAGPEVIHKITSRLANHLTKLSKKVDVAVIRFMPMMNTIPAQKNSQSVDPLFYRYLDVKSDLSLRDARDLHILSDTIFLKSMGKQLVEAHSFRILTLLEKAMSTEGDIDGITSRYRSEYINIWASIQQEYGEDPWRKSEAGEVDVFSAENGHLNIKKILTESKDDVAHAGYEYHKWMYGCTELDFSHLLIDEFQQAIEDLQKISDHVVIFYLPEHYFSRQSQPDTNAKIRLTAQLANLKRLSPAVDFLDYSEMNFTDEDFFDITHMTPSGKKKLNDALGRDLTAMIHPK